MKILVIGCKGFIGSSCYSYFKERQGNEVFGADVVAEYNEENYFLIDGSNNDFKEVFRTIQFDYCINCAGAASVPDSFIHPLRDYLLNVQHVVLLLNAIKDENPQCKLIQLSSAAVYGNPSFLPIKEDHGSSPVSPYGLHKSQAEDLCELFARHYQISSNILRIFSAYGAGLKKQLFYDLSIMAAKNDRIQLHGTGRETREFIHVHDIVRAIEIVIQSGLEGFNVINIANAEPSKINDVAQIFLDCWGFTGKLSFNGIVRTGDPLFWQADTTKLKNLGYRESIGFEEGINNYCKWLREKK